MFSNVRSIVPLFRKCVFLLLALSVFGFGLHARLEQYQPYPPNPTASKLATEERSEEVLKVLTARDETPEPDRWLIRALLLSGLRMQPVFPSAIEQAEISLSNPTRLDLNGLYSLHRPPPTLL